MTGAYGLLVSTAYKALFPTAYTYRPSAERPSPLKNDVDATTVIGLLVVIAKFIFPVIVPLLRKASDPEGPRRLRSAVVPVTLVVVPKFRPPRKEL